MRYPLSVVQFSREFIYSYWKEVGDEIVPSFRIVAIVSAIVVFVSGPLSDMLAGNVVGVITISRYISIFYCLTAFIFTFVKPRFIQRNFQLLYGLAVVLIMMPNAILSASHDTFSNERLLDFIQVQIAFVLFIPISKKNTVITLLTINLIFLIASLYGHPVLDRSVAGFVLNVLIFGVICYYGHHLIIINRYKDYQKTLTIKELNEDLNEKNLRLKINPHFIFNILTSIANLVLTKETKRAYSQLMKFSGLLRANLDQADINYHSIDDEVSFLKSYIELQQELKGNFRYHIEVSNEIDQADTLIPILMIQPYVENAIMHGFNNSSKENFLRIEISRFNNLTLAIMVDDNGVGKVRALSVPSNLKRKSHGMNITESRVRKAQKEQITLFEIIDKSEYSCETGTVVNFHIPLNTNY